MKKIIIAILFLAIGVFIFLTGNISFFLSNNEYAVVFTKTSGWLQKIIQPAEISWLWQRMIPFNTTVYKYSIIPQKNQITLSGKLPSADAYSSVLPTTVDFSYNADISLNYKINPDSILALAKKGIYPEKIESFYGDTRSKIKEIVSQLFINNKIDLTENIKETIKKSIEEEIKDIVIEDIIIDNINIPDFEIYNQAKKIYMQITEEQAKIKIEISKQEGLREEKDKILIDRLQKYGKLLKENPEILEYFKLNPNNPDPLGIFEGL